MHNCPECRSACYCGGDIDDIDTGDKEAEENCTHCDDGDGEDFEGEFDPVDLDNYEMG